MINHQLFVKAGHTIAYRRRVQQGGQYFKAELLHFIDEMVRRRVVICGRVLKAGYMVA